MIYDAKAFEFENLVRKKQDPSSTGNAPMLIFEERVFSNKWIKDFS
jgi:hypothetical protein